MLERLDRGRRRIAFQDITAPSFEPEFLGLDDRAVMDRIHGVLPDGSVVEGFTICDGLEANGHALAGSPSTGRCRLSGLRQEPAAHHRPRGRMPVGSLRSERHDRR